MTDAKNTFLYASISDLQGTIRSCDTKVSYLLVILFLPLTKLTAIFTKCKSLICSSSCPTVGISITLTVVFTLLWFAAVFAALRTIIAINNPVDNIKGDVPLSTFYPAFLFSFSNDDVFSKPIKKSSKDFTEYKALVPNDSKDVAEQLICEQMKLMYIAGLKLKRSVFAYWATIAWVMCGGVLWILHLVYCS